MAEKKEKTPAPKKKYLFSYFFEIYNAERALGEEKVDVAADDEDEAMTAAVEHVPTKEGEGFRYTGRFTKKAIA